MEGVWDPAHSLFFFSDSILEVGGEAGECPLLKPLVCAELSLMLTREGGDRDGE